MNYRIKFDENYLEHHGILGQQWGKRNGPPYPLDLEDHSSSEKKAGWKKSLKTRRLESAVKANERDVKDLRSHGYNIEADAVEKVGKKAHSKLDKSIEKDRTKAIKKDLRHNPYNDEAHEKSVESYKKASDYAYKNKIEYDAYIYEYERDSYLQEAMQYGIPKETAKAVLEYSKLTDIADAESENFYNEATRKHIEDLIVKYGEEPVRRIVPVDEKGKIYKFSDDSKVTKRVKDDFNELSKQEFRNKYGVSKDTYAARVTKYGDPYMNAPLAKIGKSIENEDTKLGKALSTAIKNNQRKDYTYTDPDGNKWKISGQTKNQHAETQKKLDSYYVDSKKKMMDDLVSKYGKETVYNATPAGMQRSMENAAEGDVNKLKKYVEISIKMNQAEQNEDWDNVDKYKAELENAIGKRI